MAKICRKYSRRAALFMAAALAFSCSGENGETDGYNSVCGNLGELDNFISIKFDNGKEPIIDNPYENDVAFLLDGENVIAQNLGYGTEYNLIVSGTTENGSLKIYGNHKMGIYLNGANITNPSGPAINIQNRQKISVSLVSETYNYLADQTPYEIISHEDAKGAFFSEGQISFSGCGSLTVAGKHRHAIAVDDDLEIAGGKIEVAQAAGSGIRAKSLRFSGGKVKIKVSSDGSKGIKTDGDVEISGGALTIKASGTGAKGINAGGNLTMTGGEVKSEANDDGVKVHGDLLVSGGNLCAWSLNKQGIDCVGMETIKSGSVNSKCVVGF